MAEAAVTKKAPVSSALTAANESPSLTSLSPFAAMRDLSDEMERMLRGVRSRADIEAWIPTMDIERCNGNLVVSAELPGLKKDDIKLEVSDDALVIEGERKQEHKEDHEGYHRWERSYGKFYRSILLPEGAKTDQVKAELKDGVLKVSIPVPETQQKTRQVAISG